MHGKTMRRKRSAGGSVLEFVFISLVLVPLFLGTGAVGVNLIRTLQTIQLARDVGHMYARGVDFSQGANQTIMYQLGSSLGLTSSSTSSTAVVILSNLIYVDSAQCLAVGAWNTGSNTPNGCTNYQKWVFTQRLEFGLGTLRSSNLGSPLTSGPTGVTVNSTTGQISQSDYVTKAGAVASFNAVNPYSSANGGSGLPSGQTLYVAEAGAQAWVMPPFFYNQSTYSFDFF